MNLLAKHHHKILWILIILYIIVFSSVCLWKYSNLGYNAIDLAIINQVFDNTLHGDFFASSIHEPSYLGDHFTPIIFLLLPFYLLFQSPITLLILQTVLLALAAWPLYLISKKIFSSPTRYLLLPVIYLFNPFVHNINIFEFHFLPIAFFIFFFAFYFYQKEKFWPFLAMIAIGLLIREDVSFFVFCFGLFILVDKLLKKEKINWKWVLTPTILSVVYLLLSIKISAHFSPSDTYKFLIYYCWLGDSLLEVIINFFTHPLDVLLHIFRLKNIEMILALLLPFMFLPLFKARYLILALGTFLQLAINDIGSSALIVQLHYVALLAVPLFIATGYGLENLLSKKTYKPFPGLIIFLLLLATFYSNFTLGFNTLKINQPQLVEVKKEFLELIPTESSVATTYEFLPILSNHSQLYSLNYSFLGYKQLSNAPYELPPDTEYILADLNEIITYQMQYEGLSFYRKNYFLGSERLRKLMAEDDFGLTRMTDMIALFEKDQDNVMPLYIIEEEEIKQFFSCQPLSFSPDQISNVHFTCQVQIAHPIMENYQLELELKNNDEVIESRLLPIAYGFYTTSELDPNELLTTAYHLKTEQTDYTELCINLVKLKGALALNKLGQTYSYIEDKKIIDSSCF